jgi:hypothetical protein
MRICVNLFIYSVYAECQTYCTDFLLGPGPTLSFQVPLTAPNTEVVSHSTMAAFVRLPECCVYEETENSIVIVIRSIDLSHIHVLATLVDVRASYDSENRFYTLKLHIEELYIL